MIAYFLLSNAFFHITRPLNSINNPIPLIFKNEREFDTLKDKENNSNLNMDDAPLPNTLTNSFASNGTLSSNNSLNNLNSNLNSNLSPHPFHYHMKPTIVIRRIPIILSSLDENSLDEESSPENNNSNKELEKKNSFFTKMKNGFVSMYNSVTIPKILLFGLFAVLFVLLGYQIRKREDRGNYVRLPNDA